jgi:hypothetical protein
VRRDHHVGVAEQRVLRDRLGAKDVERRPAHLARVERRAEVLVDDERPPGDVEDPHAVLALGERFGVEPALGLGRLRKVEGDEVGAGVDVVGGLGLLHAEVAVAIRAHERVEGDDVHAEGERPVGHELADAPEAEDPERLVHELDARVLGAVPAPRDQRRMRLRHVPRQGEQQRERVLRGGDHVGLRRVGDDDPALRGGIDVHVVHADARATDGLEIGGVPEDVRRELRRRADEDAVVGADGLLELAVLPVRAHVDVEVLAQQTDTRGPDLLRDQDARHDPTPRRSTTQSTQAVSCLTSSGSIAGNIAMRS